MNEFGLNQNKKPATKTCQNAKELSHPKISPKVLVNAIPKEIRATPTIFMTTKAFRDFLVWDSSEIKTKQRAYFCFVSCPIKLQTIIKDWITNSSHYSSTWFTVIWLWLILRFLVRQMEKAVDLVRQMEVASILAKTGCVTTRKGP